MSKEVNNLVKQMMNEEMAQNNNVASDIVKKISDIINIDQFLDVDTSVQIIINVRKWEKMATSWSCFKYLDSTFSCTSDFHELIANVDRLSIQWVLWRMIWKK